MSIKNQEWEAVISLKIHAELNTKSKLFSRAPNHLGDQPNTNITEVCTGQPGALPVLNREAVRKAAQFGRAIEGTIAKFSQFDRKMYFYPDHPRNFQITQHFKPIVVGGKIVVEVDGVEMSFGVARVHLEDDTGILKHFSNFVGVDYNRAGVPLIVIVSDPCIHTPEQAVAYCIAVKRILQCVDASDCSMEKGLMRVDAEVSVRLKGEKDFRNSIEIKNVNDFNYMKKALEWEIERQVQEYVSRTDIFTDQVIQQASYRWDSEKKELVLILLRDSGEYRYIPDPDLMPIILTDEYVEEIRRFSV